MSDEVKARTFTTKDGREVVITKKVPPAAEKKAEEKPAEKREEKGDGSDRTLYLVTGGALLALLAFAWRTGRLDGIKAMLLGVQPPAPGVH